MEQYENRTSELNIMEENVDKLWEKLETGARNVLIIKKIKIIELEMPNGGADNEFTKKKVAHVDENETIEKKIEKKSIIYSKKKKY